jgi:hypothetical protein
LHFRGKLYGTAIICVYNNRLGLRRISIPIVCGIGGIVGAIRKEWRSEKRRSQEKAAAEQKRRASETSVKKETVVKVVKSKKWAAYKNIMVRYKAMRGERAARRREP